MNFPVEWWFTIKYCVFMVKIPSLFVEPISYSITIVYSMFSFFSSICNSRVQQSSICKSRCTTNTSTPLLHNTNTPVTSDHVHLPKVKIAFVCRVICHLSCICVFVVCTSKFLSSTMCDNVFDIFHTNIFFVTKSHDSQILEHEPHPRISTYYLSNPRVF